MKFLSRLLTIVLTVTLLAGIGVAAYLLYSNLSVPTPTAPTVEFRSVEVGDVVTIAVVARGERVVRAELWSEDKLLARDINPNPALTNTWPLAWQWTPPGPGVFSLAARAFDDAGRYGASSLFSVVIPPNQHLLFSSNRDGNPALAPSGLPLEVPTALSSSANHSDTQSSRTSHALYSMAIKTRETTLFDTPRSEDRQPNVSRANVAAFASNRAGAWHILTRATDADQASDITPDLSSAQRPVWSADGQQLAFEVTISNTTNIFVSDAQGQNRKQVTNADTYDGQASFNPSGDRLAFAAQQGGQWDVYAVNLDGTNLTRLTTDAAQDWQPAWSPDGNHIAFASNRDGISQIYVMGSNGENVTQLTDFPSGAEQPAWSPDGNWLAFVAYTGAAEGENRREIYLLYAPQGQALTEGRGLIRLTQNTFDDTEPAWMGK